MGTREELYDALYKELIGPGNTQSVYLIDNNPEREILLARVHGAPHKRYGAGLLYPRGVSDILIEDELENQTSEDKEPESLILEISSENSKNGASNSDNSHTDDPVGMANSFKPSALGITFRIKAGAIINLIVKSARYQPIDERPVFKKDNEGNIIPSVYVSGDSSGQPILSNAWERIPISGSDILPIITTNDWKRGQVKSDVFIQEWR